MYLSADQSVKTSVNQSTTMTILPIDRPLLCPLFRPFLRPLLLSSVGWVMVTSSGSMSVGAGNFRRSRLGRVEVDVEAAETGHFVGMISPAVTRHRHAQRRRLAHLTIRRELDANMMKPDGQTDGC